MFQGVSDVFLPVSDLHRSVEWYERILGFRRLWIDDAKGAAGRSLDAAGVDVQEITPSFDGSFACFAFPRRFRLASAWHRTLGAGSGSSSEGVLVRWLRHALQAACGLLVLVVAAGVAMYVLTPSVADAQARVRTMAHQDGASHLSAPVPRLFAESIVASEDSRFYSEPGVDPIGIARAAWMTVTSSAVDPGGSTLSQQLAKQLYTHGHTGLRNDAEQVGLAVKLNLHYSKAQILRMYADTVYFGHNLYGLYDASCGYFAVPPQHLSLAQASLLAGLVQAPSAYDPLKHLGLARSRQHYVLGRLAATGKVAPSRARAAAAAPLHLNHAGVRACHG